LKNNGKQDYSVLKWSTPLERKTSNCLTVTRNGKKLEYDGIYRKRGVPGPDQFLTVGPGQTLSSTFQVSDAFDMTKPGVYSVAVDTYLEYVIGSAASKPDIKRKIRHLSSPAVSFQIVGRGSSKGTLGQKARFLESRRQTKQNRIFDGTFGDGVSRKKVLPKPPVIMGGTPALKADTEKAHGIAYNTILSKFLADPEKKKLLVFTWFGINPVGNVALKFKQITDVLGKETITYIFDGPDCDPGDYAYTTPYSRTIYLCGSYKTAKLSKGDDNKMGTLTHELSHAVINTDDHTYSKNLCLQMAQKKPLLAIDNANNFEYFVEAL